MPVAKQSVSDTYLAVFAKARDVQLIDLMQDAERAKRDSMAALARGYVCCGYFSVVNGKASVQCEPGLLAAFGMMHAGVAFAEMLCANGTAN